MEDAAACFCNPVDTAACLSNPVDVALVVDVVPTSDVCCYGLVLPAC